MKGDTTSYAATITDTLLSLVDPDNENSLYDLDKIDATKFFTGMVQACAVVYSRLTGDYKTFLEFTHLANALIVQELMKDNGEAA